MIDEPLPLGITDTGQRLPLLDDEAVAEYASQRIDAGENEMEAVAQKAKDHLGGDDSITDYKNLAQTGWAVLYAPSVTPAMKKALAPLLERRQRQVGDDALCPDPFEGETGYQPKESADQWLYRVRQVQFGDVNPRAGVPYYLLIVGPPTEIPFEFQFRLDYYWATGRLWFETAAEFRQYAESVVAYESGETVETTRQMAVFSPRNGDDIAANLVSDNLAMGMQVSGTKNKAFGENEKFRLKPFVGAPAQKEKLQQILRGQNERPSLLFTASHGMAFASEHGRLASDQGAIVCDDFAGDDPPATKTYFAARDLEDDFHVGGLIHVLFACYGGGWPEFDTYARTISRPERVAPQPGIARLPQRMLAHPNGSALAVIAHVDRAWSSSYYSGTAGASIEGFRSVVTRLCQGLPVGHATDRMNQRCAKLAMDLNTLLQKGITKGKELKNRWIAYDDARNYVIYGDPAVRLREELMPPLS